MALLAGLTVSCARATAGPYRLGFALDGRSPRVLETSQEIAVALTATNTGERAWDPSRIHLSYHWLWLMPRETIARSRWNVPYHDGIRTELGRRVAPRESIAVQGRVLAPSTPGLYWLQWDMVEEGASWFAQLSPRQPRTLVLVSPPLAWLFAPLPLIAAIGGLIALRRRRAGRAELLLSRRVRPWVLVVVGLFASTLILGDVVYYRFFGDVLSAPALLGAHQTGRVAGSIRSLLTPGLVWLALDWPFAIWLAVGVSRLREPAAPFRVRAATTAAALGLLAVAGMALSAPRVLASTPVDQMFRNRSVAEQLGPLAYHAYDGWNYAHATWLHAPATAAQIADAREWFAARADLRAGPGRDGFAAARGRNLIVVQVESLQDFVVDYRVNGEAVMPHLRAWTSDSLRFTNVTDQTNEGRTSDAEFTTLASLLPLDHGAVAFRFPGNHYVALPRVLVEHGYATLSAVAFEPGFWNRQVLHPSYGFQKSLFEPDFQMTEQIGWGLNDRDFLQQMVPRLEQLPRPFAAWMITLSLHHPFDSFPDAHKELRLGALEGTSFGNYLHTMRFFDSALAAFRESLVRDHLLDDSVVVVFGDHDAGFTRERGIAKTIGIGADEAAWTLNDRVPLFIRLPRPPDRPGPPDQRNLSGPRSTPAGQTDFAPTLLALLGIDAAPLPFVGRNLLGPAGGAVVRPYGGWLDAHHLHISGGSTDGVCYDVSATRSVSIGTVCVADVSERAGVQYPRVMRLLTIVAIVPLLLASAHIARAQEAPARIPPFVVDLHASLPRFPQDDGALAASRGMSLVELPGAGLGLQAGVHLYPLKWKAVTFGIGGEIAMGRAKQTPLAGVDNVRPSVEEFTSISPQLSFNFGTGKGWSYISGGIGTATWAVTPQGQEGFPADTDRLRTTNYGFGARWFMKSHMAFSFDVRVYTINAGFSYFGLPASPLTALLIIGAGVSLK